MFKSLKAFLTAHREAIVWMLRIVVGLVFLGSGLVKCIDLWGFVYKIEEYLAVWNVPQPRSLVEMTALTICCAEFAGGVMLMLGAYRRVAVWGLTAMMTVMLPLTAYIYIYSPVSDCGCFGDFIVLSNGATFLKNILIMAALVYLLRTNHKVKGLIHPYLQWIGATACCLFMAFVGIYGLMVQPMVDFRSFAPGTMLLSEDETDEDSVDFEFLYEKNGEFRTFGMDNLPDSTWTFVERKIVGGSGDTYENRTEFRILDDGEDVTEEAVATDGEQIIIVMPQYERADVSYTYIINELQKYVTSRGGNLIEAASIGRSDLPRWRDLSMADYPIYQGESVMLKELARGVMAAVYTVDGRIVWKRTLGSIDTDLIDGTTPVDGNALDLLLPLGGDALGVTSALLAVVLLCLILPTIGLKWCGKSALLENNK